MAINFDNRIEDAVKRRFKRGKPYTFFFEKTYTAEAIGNAAIVFFSVPIGKFLILDEISVDSTSATPILVAGQVLTVVGNVDTTTNNIIGTRSLDSNQVDWRGYTSLTKSFSPILGAGTRFYDRTTITFVTRDTGVTGFTGRIICRASGTLYDMSQTYESQRLHIGIGDSILAYLNGGTNYTYKQLYFSLITEYFRKNKTVAGVFYPGQNICQDNKAEGGRTSTNGDIWLEAGYYDLPEVSLCTYNFMVNDAMGTLTTDKRNTFKQNLRNLILWYQSDYRGKPLIIVSATPVTDDAVESNCVILRQDAFDVVSEYEGALTDGTNLSVSNPLSLLNETINGKILYLNAGISFDRTNIQFYNNSLSDGDGLHPNAIRGHAAIASQVIYPALNEWLPRL
jgi:lysophospholipase L1-like esterase